MGIDEEIKQKEKELDDLIALKEGEIEDLRKLKKMIDEEHSYLGYSNGTVYLLSDIPEEDLNRLCGVDHCAS